MSKRRVRVWIKGRVQGVFFRAYTRDAAVKEGLSGWVKNMADGKVEALFEGDADKVERLIEWCRNEGSPLSRIESLEIREEVYQGDLDSFEISYGR
ncbi:MAG: acylphosphatase [Syntrophobacteraceae bacterium]